MKYTALMTLILATGVVMAEENVTQGQIKIPVSQQGDVNIKRPTRGMLMADVEQQFGAPIDKQGPIGQPPITRWHYENYTVIFEHNHVVHTVLKMKAPSSDQPIELPTKQEDSTKPSEP